MLGQMSYRSLLAAVGLIAATIFQAAAQPSVPTGPVEVDLDEATSHFKEMFERTYYRQRHTLRSMIADRPSPEFEKIPRQYPVRDETEGTTLLVEWGVLTHSGPYRVGLLDSDTHPNTTSCVLRAVAIRKEALKDVILRIDGLYFFEEKENNESKIIGFMHRKERNLQVLCITPKAEKLYVGNCYLWFWPETSS